MFFTYTLCQCNDIVKTEKENAMKRLAIFVLVSIAISSLVGCGSKEVVEDIIVEEIQVEVSREGKETESFKEESGVIFETEEPSNLEEYGLVGITFERLVIFDKLTKYYQRLRH